MSLQEDLEALVASGHVRKRRHPKLPLTLYNYSQTAAFEFRRPSDWPEALKAARGIVFDDNGVCVARPFDKFFNVSEHTEGIPGIPKYVMEKMDGSLIIAFAYQGEVVVATRGSFESVQAAWGEELLAHKYPMVYWRILRYPGQTFMFELIHPENRIVVNYGDEEKLVLLGAREASTGEEVDVCFRVSDRREVFHGVDVVRHYPARRLRDLMAEERRNCEGYVVIMSTGQRVKVKHEEYCRLHKIMTGITKQTVWEWVSNRDDWKTMLDSVPDEMYDWVAYTARELEDLHARMFTWAYQAAEKFKVEGDRKATALAIKAGAPEGLPHGLIFGAIDGKDISPQIWKNIKPEATSPWDAEDDS